MGFLTQAGFFNWSVERLKEIVDKTTGFTAPISDTLFLI
jgi:hypothetical protein